MDQQESLNAQATQPVDQQSMPPEIHTFLDNILTDANITNLDEETREERLKELYGRRNKLTASKFGANLRPKTTEAFIKMNEEKKSQAEVQQFLTEKIPDAQQVMTQAFMDFREMYLGNVSVARNAPAENNNQGNT